jgi:hypothetical protein
MRETTVERYVSGDDERERLRPVLISIMANFGKEQAVDMILGLVEVRRREVEPLPVALPEPERGTREPRNAPAKRTRPPRAPPPLDTSSGARALTPFEWYTVAEAAAFLGIGEQSIRNILRDHPDDLVSKKENGERGHRTIIQGRGILALRHKRQQAAAPTEPENDDGEGDQEEDTRASPPPRAPPF